MVYLRFVFVSERVHPHGDLKVVHVVQEHGEVFELLEGDPLLLLDPLLQPLQDVVIVLAVEEGVAEQDEREVELSDGRSALGELCELCLDDLGLPHFYTFPGKQLCCHKHGRTL